MNLSLVVLIALGIIVLVFSFKLLKGIFRTLLNLVGIVFFILALVSLILYLDGRKANELMQEGEKIILYETDGEFVSGVRIEKGELTIMSEGGLPSSVTTLNQEERETYLPMLEKQKYKEKEFVVIVRDVAFNESFVPFEIMELEVEQNFFNGIMTSDTPKRDFAVALMNEQGISVGEEELFDEEFERSTAQFSDEEFKNGLFLSELSLVMQDGSGKFLLSQVKKGGVIVSPTFLTTKIIGWLPDKIFERSLNRSLSMSNEKRVSS